MMMIDDKTLRGLMRAWRKGSFYEYMQMHVEAAAFVNDLAQGSLFSIAMSVPATHFLEILRIFKMHARFLTRVIDKPLTKKPISMK
jgi:hypothetical protein